MTSAFQLNTDNSGLRLFLWAAAGLGASLLASMVYRRLNRYNLKDKVVLVTGGSRGLGLVLARQLARKGAKLAICARTAEQLDLAKQELQSMGAEVIAIQADITDQEQVKNLVRQVKEYFNKIDVVINNAGIIQVGPYDSMDIKEYEDAMKINFWAPLYTMMTAIPYFQEQGGGRIVNITSIGGKIAVPHLLPYTASKFAVVGLSEGLHAELKKHKVVVTTVIPNLMRTGSPRNVIVKGNHEAEYAWFKIADSSPLLSQKVDVAANRIIEALENGEAEVVLSLTARMVTVLKGVAPSLISAFMGVANKFLPDNVDGGNIPKKGHHSESELSQGKIASLSDEAASENNER